MRANRATIVENVFARTTRVQDDIAEFQCHAAAGLIVVDTAAITSGQVATKSAVAYGHIGTVAHCSRIADTAAVVSRVAADSAVAYIHHLTRWLGSARIADAAAKVG